MREVARWLTENGLERFIDLFAANEIDWAVLRDLNDDHFKELGIPLGSRIKLRKAIAALGDTELEPTSPLGVPGVQSPTASPERRQLTVMFVDLVGSTALSRRLDPEDMRRVITAYQTAVAGICTRFEGHVANYMGDGVLCYFGWPRAHEDDAERAARAGLAVVELVACLLTPGGEGLSARVGIATGLVVVGDLIGEGAAQQEAVVGDTPNLAARLQGLAMPGQVVIAATTRRLLADMFEVVELGNRALKGIDGMTSVYAVAAERAATSRFDARTAASVAAMVGRDHELGLVLEKWQQAKAGDGQFLLLTGDAGIGKSRVVRALIDKLVPEPHHRISHQCSPYFSDSALYPVIQQLTFATGSSVRDSASVGLDKLEAIVQGGVDAKRLIAALLGIDPGLRYGPLELSPEQQRAQTLRALVAELIAQSSSHPVLWVVEDLHWSDATTLELIELCLDQVARSRIMILATARPTFDHGFGGHPIVTRLALNRLGRDPVRAIVDRLARGKALPDAVVHEITVRTDGVPLFVEELTKAVLESGRLAQTTAGFALTTSLEQLAIPATLHDSLMARLDRLQPVKEVAQTAACIGREFSFQLLQSICTLGKSGLEDALARLLEAELIFRRHHAAESTYVFKHALVRDAAYESLLKSRRQSIHAKLVDALEADRDTAPELLAHHATYAGMTQKAIGYWQQAGVAALARPAYQEAIGHLRNALALVPAMGNGRVWLERELDLLVMLAQALIPKFGWSAEVTVQAYARGLELVEQLGDTPNRFPVLFGVWVGHLVRSETPALVARAENILELAERDGGEIPWLMARRFAGVSHMMAGNLRRSRDHLDFVLSVYRPENHSSLAQRFGQDPGAQTLGYMCILYWVIGLAEQASRYADAAELAAEASAHVTTSLDVSWNLCTFAMCVRDDQRLEHPLRRLVTLSAQHNLAIFREVAECAQGIRLARRGEDVGVAQFQAGYAAVSAAGVGIYMPLFVVEHARTLLGLQRKGDARRQIDLALDLLERTGERWAAAEVHHVDGHVHLAEGDRLAAEADFRRAIDVARPQEAKSWELRACVSLARLWADGGQRRRAYDLLAPISNGFTEGFDTPDLVEARALLDALS